MKEDKNMSLFSTLLVNGGYACYSLGCPFINREYDGCKPWSDNLTDDVKQLNNFHANSFNRKYCNNYLSVSTFRNGSSRRESNVKEVKRLYIDMDAHDNPINLDEAKLLASYMIDNWFDECELPEPNYIIFSGHGLQILFTLDGCNSVPEWKRYQTALLKTCQDLLKDLKEHSLSEASVVAVEHDVSIDNLKDAARVLRVPNTTNYKPNQEYVDVKLLYSNEDHAYTLNELNTNYTAFSNDNLGPKKDKKKTQKKTKSEPTERDVDLSGIDMDGKQAIDPHFFEIIEKTIKPRLSDLETLIRIRNEAGTKCGYRNNLIAIYIPTLVSCGYKNEYIIKEAHRINSLFNKPLKRAEVNDWLNSCLTKKEVMLAYK